MQYSGRGPQPGPGFGGQGIRPDPASQGGGPMPMPGGPMGGGGMGQPMPGGPQPMPKPSGPGGPGGGGMGQLLTPGSSGPDYRSAIQGGQARVDQAMMDLERAQIMGADPMVLARLRQEAQGLQRDFANMQQQAYATQMGQMSQRGPGGLGGGRGQTQMEQNPYLQMLLQSQLGMGGGGGSPSGGLSSIGRG